jgi:PAS domain S-box-containing protein
MVKSNHIVEEDSELLENEDKLQKIRKREKQLADLLEYSSQPFGVGYPDGRLGLINRAFEELTGYRQGELQKTDWSNTLTPPEFRDMEKKKLEKLQKTGQPIRYEKEYIRKDGTRVPIELLVHLIRNEDGTPQYYYSFITDITERKKAEEALSASEENYRHLVQYAPTAIYEIDYKGPRFKSVNDGMIQLSGYSRDELLSMNPIDLLDSESRQSFKERINKVTAGEEIDENVEFKVFHKDGHKLWVILNVKPTYTDNKLNGALVVGYDITKRKKLEEKRQELLEQVQLFNEELEVSNQELQSTTEELRVANEELHQQRDELTQVNKALKVSEESYRSIIENLQDAYIQADKEGIIIMASPSAARMYRFDSPQEMIGISAQSLYKNPEDRNHLLEQLLKQGKVEDHESEALRMDGSSFLVSLNSQFNYDNHGQILGTEAFVRDITQRKEREVLNDALNTVNTYINSTLDYDEIMQLIVEEGSKAIGSESAVINIRENDNWVVKFVYNFPDNIIGQIKSDLESPTSVYVANEKQAVAFNDAPNDSRVNRNGMKLHGVTSLLVAPIILKDKVIGVIAFYHHQKSVIFSEAQIDFTNKLASSLSQAIENAQLFEEIKKSEEKYHSLYSSMNEGVALHEIIYNSHQEAVDYVIMDINPAYEEITGLKISEVVGMKASELYGTGTPPYMDFYAPVAENSESTEFETYFEPMDKNFHISVISPGKGKFATIFEDITERKQAEAELTKYQEQLENLVEARTTELKDAYESLKESEAQYLTLFNSIDEGFCTIEVIFDEDNKPIDYRFLEINPAFEKQTGLKGAEGKLMRDLAPNHEEHWFEIYGKIALTGKPMRFENPAKELNRWYDVYAFKIGDPESREVAILFNDITKRKKVENELKEYQDTLEEKVEKRTEQLEKSNAELEQFAYVSSHDLQEPIRMVTSFTQLLQRRYEGQLDADADDYIGFIVEGALRMKYLIDDLLEFSRVSSRVREFGNVDLEKVLDVVLYNLSVSIKENDAVITHDSLPNVITDESQMRQVFQNLIANAIKFHGSKQPKIHITAQKDNKEWRFAVIDNGIGIDPVYQKQIFEVFKRLHTRAEYPGSGIGLSVAQKIVRRHEGNIWVESKLGKGSTFYFTIPNKLN